jgi:hypothetical protein
LFFSTASGSNRVSVDPANARELAQIASEISADGLTGDLRYPSETGGWQLGDLDLSEYLDRYCNQRAVLIIAPVGQAGPAMYICSICGFVMNHAGECPRCRLSAAKRAAELLDGENATPDVLT